MFDKVDSLRKSEIVFELVNLNISEDDTHSGWLDTFNNCRETGLSLTVIGKMIDGEWKFYENSFIAWVYQHRNSDNIQVICSNSKHCSLNNMFDDKAWENSKGFGYKGYDEASDYIISCLEDYDNENIKVDEL